jgi:ketosteroid isomerase-like protein
MNDSRIVRLSAVIVLWLGGQAASAGVAEQIIAALERYRVAVLELDIDGQVASFAEDAQVSEGSDPTVQGRTTIRALLQSQAGYKVVGYELRTAATRVEGAVAFQSGVYTERIITPQHESKIMKGVFEVDWSRQADGSWLINRLHTGQVEGDPVGRDPVRGFAS